MKRQAPFFIAFTLVLGAARFFAIGNIAPTSVLGAERNPVLVELFTSEGCSSCPSADALLARLNMTQPYPSAEVIILEQHVDYWDGQGWPDPFASSAATRRQESYAGILHSEVYTPQMIVDGHAEFVGSNVSNARNAILAAAGAPKAAIHLDWTGDVANHLRPLRVRVEQLPAGVSGGSAEVFLAVTESHLHSNVRAGENDGRALDHDGVVRNLTRIGKADQKGDVSFLANEVVKLFPEWKTENVRAVVFVQDSHTRRVLGVAEIKY